MHTVAVEKQWTMPPNPENLKPFQKGGDPRIWKGGRPKSFSALQELAQQIAHETAKAGGATVVVDWPISAIKRWKMADLYSRRMGMSDGQ